nr:uncharacterized protein LOC105335200 isoform X1 [Crassostrea gigas]
MNSIHIVTAAVWISALISVHAQTDSRCSLDKYFLCDDNADCTDNVDGSFTCTCKPDYQGDGLKGDNHTGCRLAGDHHPCNNETAAEECHSYAFCSAGGYCECNSGYKGDGKNDCKDIDECATLNPCHVNANCQNQLGTFECICKAGYKGDGYNCTYYCTHNEQCHSDAVCVNSECVCNGGFSGNGTHCTDVNECDLKTYTCDPNAECENIVGSYYCICNAGYTGSGKSCTLMPKNCDEIFQKNKMSKDGVYTIDADGTGPIPEFQVYCDMRPNLGITIMNTTAPTTQITQGRPEVTVTYNATHPQITKVIETSNFCYQYMGTTCRNNAKTLDGNDYWVDGKGTQHKTWGGATFQGKCSCGQMRYCETRQANCNCDGTRSGVKDEGKILDKALLPIQKVHFGLDSSSQLMDVEIGNVVCGPKPFDFPIDCDDAKFNTLYKVKEDGPQIIDIDGPDGPANPVLVHCDMESYPHVGITVIPHDNYDPVSPTAPEQHSLTYVIDKPSILKIIEESAFCRQEVEYSCTDSRLMNGGDKKGFFSDLNGVVKDYWPGGNGVAGMCGCGLTKTCAEPDKNCNCDTMDGRPRKDIGVVTKPEDLPVGSVTFNEIGDSSSGQYFVAPLKCSRQEFGFEVNCQGYLNRGQNYSYTYMVDVDGPAPRDKSDPTNVEPFPVECQMQVEPPLGITIVHHEQESQQTIIGGSLSFKYRFVTDEQLAKLRVRSVYCSQSVVHSCVKSPVFAQDGTSIGYWEDLSGTKHYYYTGKEGEGCACSLTQSCAGGSTTKCNCDINDNTLRNDTGTLVDKEVLPVKKMVFSVTGTSTVDIGPLRCLEVFPTCADLYNFMIGKRFESEKMLDSNRDYTVDPDGAEGVDPFVVSCQFPMTVIKIGPGYFNYTYGQPGDSPVTKCFQIDYEPDISKEQIQALVEKSSHCTQHLRYTCKNAPKTGKVTYSTCDGTLKKGWGGSGGIDACACGTSGTCEGPAGAKCNCDLEDGQSRSDDGWIYDKTRLPVCEVCITLDPTTPVMTSRTAAYVVSNLHCNSGPIGMYGSCQARRNTGELKNVTTYVDPDGLWSGEPGFPVYCSYIPHPPVGFTEIRPKEPEVIVEYIPGEIEILYYLFNITMVHSLVEKSQYCEQEIYVLCNGAPQPSEQTGRKMNDWEPQAEGGGIQCKAGSCICTHQGTEVYGGFITVKDLLPVSWINLPQSTQQRKLVTGAMKCYDVYPDCNEIKLAKMDKNPLRNNLYAIDPDGAGGVPLFPAYCDFKTNERIGITEIPVEEPGVPFKLTVTGQPDPEKNKHSILYPDATPEQIHELTSRSSFCHQGIQYECVESPITDAGYYDIYNGSSVSSFGTGYASSTEGCACTLTNTCPAGRLCHCDAKGSMVAYDVGEVTDGSILPVTELSFGGQTTSGAKATATLTNVRCGPPGEVFDLPKDCEEAYKNGFKTGEVMIWPTATIKPFFVYCDMELVPNHGVTIIGNDREEKTPVDGTKVVTVTYNNVTEEQVESLTHISSFCFQPVKYDCYNTLFIGSNLFNWVGGNVQDNRFLGIGGEGECTCAKSQQCGGNVSEAILRTRKCNCDAAELQWRRDGGVINSTSKLPVKTLNFMDSQREEAQGIITLGKLYCAQVDFDLDECKMDFDDCDSNAVCINKYGSFGCKCKAGYNGYPEQPGRWANGRNCFDDDECALLRCPHSAVCTNTIGSFKCTCKAGYIQTSPTTCQDINECADPSLNDCDPNAKCYNLEGTFECRCKRGYRGDGKICESVGLCSCFGDPHCISFDQRWLHFQGDCQYVMSKDGCHGTTPTYQVLTTHWNQDRPEATGVSWVKSVTVILPGYTVELLQNYEVRVNQLKRTLPYKPEGRLLIRRYGNWVEVYSELGVQVNWDGFQAVEIQLTKSFQNQTCGLCGDYNQNPDDDWRLGPECDVTGEITENFNKFGNSYVVKSYADNNPTCSHNCFAPPEEPECKETEKQIAEYYCNQVFDLNGKLKSCLTRMEPSDLEQYKTSCVYDVCWVNDEICKIASQLVKDCQNNYGMNLTDWRSPKLCEITCGENMEYLTCATSDRMKTCADIMGTAALPTQDLCQEGCYCKEGMVLDGDKCVDPGDCGCNYKGEYYTAGQVLVPEGCDVSMVCSETTKKFDSTPLKCHTDASCKFEDGIYGCHCNYMYRGDGQNCTYDPCGNKPCGKNQTCVVTDTGFVCECMMGYQGDCNKCEDIDECATQTDKCPDNSQCINTPGSYRCECWSGFTKIGEICEDIDECEITSLNKCNSSTRCFNRPGGYHCEPCDDASAVKCCACFGYRCKIPGQVCGTDGKTYNSEKDLIIEACETGKSGYFGLRVDYKGPCIDVCQDQCPTWQKCRIDDKGKPTCECEECTAEESQPDSPKVCSNMLDLYPNMCVFKKVMCMLDLEHVPLNTTTPCFDKSGEPVTSDWSPWTTCSVTCGRGTQTRTRKPTRDFDAFLSGKYPLEDVKKCYMDPCPDGPCYEFNCTVSSEVCLVIANKAKCECPECSGLEEDSVCAMVGPDRDTYKNPCEARREACNNSLPMEILNEGECGVAPLNCTRMPHLISITSDDGCVSHTKINVAKCDGGCGKFSTLCCDKAVTRKEDVALICPDNSVKHQLVDVIEECKCKPAPKPTK